MADYVQSTTKLWADTELPEIMAGFAAIAIAACGLAGVAPPIMAATATIVVGAALIANGAGIISCYSQLSPFGRSQALWNEAHGLSVSSAVLTAGVTGSVLGILSLCDINPAVLTPAASIAFGAGVILKSNALWQIHLLRRLAAIGARRDFSGNERGLNEVISDNAAAQAMAGLASAILGSLAVAGNPNDLTLTLVSVIIVAASVIFGSRTMISLLMKLARVVARA